MVGETTTRFAFPLLQEFNAPATIFLTSGYVGTNQWFWPEEVGWVVRAVYADKLDITHAPNTIAEMIKNARSCNCHPLEVVERIIILKDINKKRRMIYLELEVCCAAINYAQ